MVDALTRIHAVLVPGAVLVDTVPVSLRLPVFLDGECVGELEDDEWLETVAAVDGELERVVAAGLFELSQFLDGPETEMMTEEEEILPERLNFVETKLLQCPKEYIPVLKELLIRGTMEQGEIDGFCVNNGIPMGHEFFPRLSGTSFLDVGERQKVWIKPVFVPVLGKLLLRPKPETDKRDN